MRKRLLAVLLTALMTCAPVVSQTGTTVGYYSQVPRLADLAAIQALTPVCLGIDPGGFKLHVRIADDVDKWYQCRESTLGAADYAWVEIDLAGGGAVTLDEGAIPFGDPSNELTFDASNLFWNDVDNRLGVGTNLPERSLHILEKDAVTGSAWDKSAQIIESSSVGNTGAVLSLYQQVGDFGALVFGTPSDILAGSIFFNSSCTNCLDFRAGGNVVRAVISGTAFEVGGPTPDFTFTYIGTAIIHEGTSRVFNFLEIGDSALWVEPDGDVGIGTATPSAALDVDGGSGRAIVELDGDTGGCLKLQDTDNGGFTYCTTLDGTLSCSITPC